MNNPNLFRRTYDAQQRIACRVHIKVPYITLFVDRVFCFYDDDDDFCYKRVQTPGMSPPRAGAWTY